MDDGSKDNTPSVAEDSGAFVLKHITNLGKGAAMKTGCDFAVNSGGKAIIVIDADGQHEPKEIPNFMKELETKDIVFGYRVSRKGMPTVFKFGNWFINKMVKLLFRMDLRDTQSGYRAFTSKAYENHIRNL